MLRTYQRQTKGVLLRELYRDHGSLRRIINQRKNRRSFIMQLAENVKRTLADFPKVKVHAERDRMHLLLNGGRQSGNYIEIAKVFGIQNFSPSIRVEKTSKC